jgi:hypothetical protein
MSHKLDVESLGKRVFVVKNPVTDFFCPLCRSKRAFTCAPRLTLKNYFQVILTSIIVIMVIWPFFTLKLVSFSAVFVVWALFELGVRFRFRSEIPCPYCGFDASWYKKDVKVARKLVKDFWAREEVKDTSKEDGSLLMDAPQRELGDNLTPKQEREVDDLTEPINAA